MFRRDYGLGRRNYDLTDEVGKVIDEQRERKIIKRAIIFNLVVVGILAIIFFLLPYEYIK